MLWYVIIHSCPSPRQLGIPGANSLMHIFRDLAGYLIPSSQEWLILFGKQDWVGVGMAALVEISNLNSFTPSAAYMCLWTGSAFDSGNGLSPARRQDITWTNVGLLSFGPLGTSFSQVRMEIQKFHSWKFIWKCGSWHGGYFVQRRRVKQSLWAMGS